MQALILTTDGFEDSEFSYPFYRLQEADWDVDVMTPGGKTVEGKHGYEFEADLAFEDADPDSVASEYDVLVLPGGGAPESLRTDAPTAADIVSAFDDRDKLIAAICHGVQLMISADVIEGREVTGYWPLEVDVENAGATYVDDAAVVDDNFVSARHPGDLPDWLSALFDVVESLYADAT
ncbi:MAG: type 1 glutamine amidotransferase domain-containing protein [Halodesulfurarchaeum sp.]